MKSKRAAIGSFISNYFSLIFLVGILGIFIITSPFIKLAVGEQTTKEESFDLNGYSSLFYALSEEYKSSSESTLSLNFSIYPMSSLKNGNIIYFYFDSSDKLMIFVGDESVPARDLEIHCSFSDDKSFISGKPISQENCDYILSFLVKDLRSSDKTKQLSTLKGVEVSYEK